MTASSIDIFPCRVQLIGLPTTSSSSLATKNNVRPPIAKVRGISRNLFGSPDPDEMKTLYQQETERIRSYVLQRYNIDTLKPTMDQEHKKQPTDKICTSQTTTNCKTQPTQIPTLTEHEMLQHNHRLSERHSVVNRLYSKPQPITEKISANKNLLMMAHKCNDISSSMPPILERKKTCRRQSLLKESFNIRKNRLSIYKSGQHFKPEKLLQERTCDIQSKETELPADSNIVAQQTAEIGENNNRTNSGSDTCATLTLHLVVPSQNAS